MLLTSFGYFLFRDYFQNLILSSKFSGTTVSFYNFDRGDPWRELFSKNEGQPQNQEFDSQNGCGSILYFGLRFITSHPTWN